MPSDTRPMELDEALQDIGPGWHVLVRELYELCDTHDARVIQIKEKFGELRAYVESREDEELLSALDAVCARSRVLCESCGRPGTQVTLREGWVKTLCPLHARARGLV